MKERDFDPAIVRRSVQENKYERALDWRLNENGEVVYEDEEVIFQRPDDIYHQ